MSEEKEKEEKVMQYIQYGIKINEDRIGFIQLPIDITNSELKTFIKQVKQVKIIRDANSIRKANN